MYTGLNFTRPDKRLFEQVKDYVFKFSLDNRDLRQEQFLVVSDEKHLLGFGRLRDYGECQELCSLGVIEPERRKGLGTMLTRKLIGQAEKDLYVVCIIPQFFERCGFQISNELPSAIEEKLNYCTNSLPVPEKYVAMVLKKIR